MKRLIDNFSKSDSNHDREFKRGYHDAKRQFDSPYQQGYRRAIEEIERKEQIRRNIEQKDYWL